jgi:hypothetical protein
MNSFPVKLAAPELRVDHLEYANLPDLIDTSAAEIDPG